MIRYFERRADEPIEKFENRLNADIDAMRDANLVVNVAPPIVFGGTMVAWSQVGASEPMTAPNGQLLGMQFKDLSVAEVEKKLEARKAALARGPSATRVLRPGQ